MDQFTPQISLNKKEKELRQILFNVIKDIENNSVLLKLCKTSLGSFPCNPDDNGFEYLKIAQENLITCKMWLNKFIHND